MAGGDELHRTTGGQNIAPDIRPHGIQHTPDGEGGGSANTGSSLSSQESQGSGFYVSGWDSRKAQEGGPFSDTVLEDAEEEGDGGNSLYNPDGGGTGKDANGDGKGKGGGLRGYLAKKGKKKIIFGSFALGMPILATVGLIVTIIMLLAPFKTVHFAEVLRSAGFARFQLTLQRQYTRTIFDAAVLTDQSTGTAANGLKGRTMLDRLRRINPEKQLLQLGNEGKLKFIFNSDKKWGGLKTTNNFVGVELYGERFTLDGTAKSLGLGDTYGELSGRNQAKVERAFGDRIAAGMNEQLASGNRAFRSEVYNGFRRVTGIKMIKWPDRAREFVGLKPSEARKLNLEESLKNIDGEGVRPKSGIKAVEDEAEAAREERIKAIEEGRIDVRSPGEIRATWAKRAKVASKVSTAAFLITVACVIHDLDTAFDQAEVQTGDRAARFGHDALTAGSQVQRGDVESARAIQGDSDTWNDAERSGIYKQMTGQKVTQDEMIDTAREIPDIRGPSGALKDTVGFIDDVLTVGGIGDAVGDAACPILLSQYVQFGIAGLELAFATVSAGTTEGVLAGVKAFVSASTQIAAGMGLGQLLGTMLDKQLQAFSGFDYSATTVGPAKFSQAAVGVDYLQQTGNRKIEYGRPLSNSEAKAAQAEAMDNLRQQNSQKSFTERYFALSNPYSLASQTLIKTPTSLTSLASTVRDSLTNTASIMVSPSKLIGGLSSVFVSPRQLVHAAGGGIYGADHGVAQYGWTDTEWEKVSTDPDYSWQKLRDYVEPNWDELEGKYRKCIDFDRQSDAPDECTREYMASDDALKWRAYNAETDGAEQLGGDVYKGAN